MSIFNKQVEVSTPNTLSEPQTLSLEDMYLAFKDRYEGESNNIKVIDK